MVYKAKTWVTLDLDVDIEAESYEEAEQKLLEIFRITPYADMDYVDGDYEISLAEQGSRHGKL